MDLRWLARLFHRRWAVPLLAELHRSRGGRFVTLAHRLGASEGAIRESLDALIAFGLVQRNQGFGHPLRPEYVLTVAGERVAPSCHGLLQVLVSGGLGDLARRKWPLPILYAVGDGAVRYSELRGRVAGITPKALSDALKALQTFGLLSRELADAHPPAVRYAHTRLGARVRVPIAELAAALRLAV